MPLLRQDAPASIPDHETLDYLLNQPNRTTRKSKKTQVYSNLDEWAKKATNLVTIGKRKEVIHGDPFGIFPSWAGNVGHPMDWRMATIMKPLYDQLDALSVIEGPQVVRMRRLFEDVRLMGPKMLAQKHASHGHFTVAKDQDTETVVTFRVGNQTARILHTKDVQKDDRVSYKTCRKFRDAQTLETNGFGEGHMPIRVQKMMIAEMMKAGTCAKMPIGKSSAVIRKWLRETRNQVRERYWLGSDQAQRSALNQAAAAQNEDLTENLNLINKHWPAFWSNNSRDHDGFRQHAVDEFANQNLWSMISEDIFVVTDARNQVIFANIENVAELLFGLDVVDLLNRCIDMWSFFVPLPAPETKRHILDGYFRRKHPERDISKGNVVQIQNAKCVTAHYGCWSTPGDPDGEHLWQTSDSRMNRTRDMDPCIDMFPGFFKAVMGKAAELIGFLLKAMDPDYYQECREVFDALPSDLKISTGKDDFLSLFALGINCHTQRHIDGSDNEGGMAGLFSLGTYTRGGNLCLPQLGCKVRYAPGACALICGDYLEHLVTENVDGSRFFVVGTNHESTRRHGLRALGRLPPLRSAGPQEKRPLSDADYEDEQEEELEDSDINMRCVNEGDDDKDTSIRLTNRYIHGPGALPGSSSEEESD